MSTEFINNVLPLIVVVLAPLYIGGMLATMKWRTKHLGPGPQSDPMGMIMFAWLAIWWWYIPTWLHHQWLNHWLGHHGDCKA
jgi:hypothetical protein